ncbi:MAG: hypothetical protein M1830_010816 [Pleopsidium flavum]|nr:MAG: hypothetical protein M1830_010816 [Pleopsidium flavum]
MEDLRFLEDDPGRQAIGSFNPLTEDDWTEMAYIGNTARLCQSIVDGDLQHVQDWCEQAGADIIDRRDHTGRTPLPLFAMASTPEVVQCLTDHGARIIVRALLEKSEANEEAEARKAASMKAAAKAIFHNDEKDGLKVLQIKNASNNDEDDRSEGDDQSDDPVMAENGGEGQTLPDDEVKDGPDIYDVNIVVWDSPVSALHLAILGGHVDIIELSCSVYGADVLLPVETLVVYSRSPQAAILTLILAQLLPNPKRSLRHCSNSGHPPHKQI